MIRLGRQSPDGLARLLETARQQAPSYPEVGATADRILPRGYRHDRYGQRVGSPEDFDRGVDGLRQWVAHRGAGVAVVPDDRVASNSTVLVVLGLGPLQMIAPCRIVRVTEEDSRFGFAYGTLPGHPERGEESFTVEKQADGTFFRVVAFSRPAEPLVRLSGPLGRAIQRTTTGRYLTALTRYVEAGK